MKFIFSLIKKVLGKEATKKIRPLGHGLKAVIASKYYKEPSEKLIKIGITGTKGKTTTTVLTGRLMNAFGLKTGYISTSVIYTGRDKEYLNPYKMTTIDSFEMQRILDKMVKNGCEYVVLEISSQGLEQNRHWGLGKFDTAAFLNLYPEHIEAHGSFENYKKAKGVLFQNLKTNGNFLGSGEVDVIKHSEWMWQNIDAKTRETCKKTFLANGKEYKIENKINSVFKYIILDGKSYDTNFVSDFEITNLAFALNIIKVYFKENFDPSFLQKVLENLKGVPGRMEFVIKSGKTIFGETEKYDSELANATVLVDYAHEPESMKQLLETMVFWRDKGYFDLIIHVLSSDGVGRDDWKKPVMGDLSLELANFTILTTDNYEEEDNPEDILSLLSKNYLQKDFNKKFFREVDRKEAFNLALNMAKHFKQKDKRVLICSTGVGTEQGLTRPGGKINWDERSAWVDLI
jgi:UDP-N-acetylmuramoyl-L-alanyl-D-glutamate--2,6-diaminopimelate ligase